MDFLTDEEKLLYSTFFPFYYQRAALVWSTKKRFVHYSSADTVMKIVKNREIWLRKASCMNDFMEIEWGKYTLTQAYESDSGERFKRAFDDAFPNVRLDVEGNFNNWLLHLTDTYFACLSEHNDHEDLMGRLSMWRAYGGATGVAVVVHSAPFILPAQASLGFWSSPVAYLSVEDLKKQMDLIASTISANRKTLAGIGAETAANHLFNIFRYAVLCNKHPGFGEELEWRIVYSPRLGRSNHLKQDVVSIGGVPQLIYKLPLRDAPDHGLTGITPDLLLDRVIIGPTEYPDAIRDAFVSLLVDGEISNPHDKIFVSNIPLRR
ncbi:MAG: DUF2971 domain-containing protein [Bauldia sp.]